MKVYVNTHTHPVRKFFQVFDVSLKPLTFN